MKRRRKCSPGCRPVPYATFRNATLVSVFLVHYCGRLPENVTSEY